MANDLTTAEKRMVRSLNLEHGKKYKGKQMMEWSTRKIEAQKGETLYFVKAFGVWMAMKD